MKIVKATHAPKPRNIKMYYLALLYAFVIVICALAQLFRFDSVVDTAATMDMFGVKGDVSYWAILEVIQLLALPFLLRVALSPLMRLVSVVAAFLVPIMWVVLAGWQLSTSNTDIGILGSEFSSLNLPIVTIVVIIIGVVGATASVACLGSAKQVKHALRLK